MSPEARKIQAYLGSVQLGVTQTTTKKVAKELLLYGMWIYNGRFLKPKCKHIGCGVYEVMAVMV